MSEIKKIIAESHSRLGYQTNRAIVAGQILVKLNNISEVFLSKKDFIQACLAYTDPSYDQIVKGLQASIQSTLANTKSNYVFATLNACNQLDIAGLARLLYVISERYYSPNNSSNIGNNGLDELMIKIAEVMPQDSILDPTSGFCGAWLKLLENNPDQKIVLQEINADFIALAYLNAKVNGANNFRILQGDVLTDPKYVSNGKLDLVDKVITFPPVSLRLNKKAVEQNKFNRFRFGKIGMRAEYAFISNAIASLKDTGKAIIAVADGPLFQSGVTARIRQNLINEDLVEAIIALPSGMVSASIPINLLVINKDKQNFKGKIQFINGNQDKWYTRNHSTNVLTSNGIEEITKIYTEKTKVDGISTIINNSDYKDSLMVKKYILPTEVIIDNHKYRLNKENLQKKAQVSLKELVEIKRGFNVTKRNEKDDGKYLAVKVVDINNKKINKGKLSHIDIPTDPLRYLLRKNDLLLSTRGTLGKVAMIDEDNTNMVASANLVALRAKSDAINMRWLMYYLASPMGKFEIARAASGTAIAIISPSDLRNIQIPVISRAEQDQAVKQFDQTKTKLDKKKKELQEQYLENEYKLYNSWKMDQVLTK